MAQDKLFSQKALAKLSSPEQLDKLIIVTDKRGWLALAAISLILMACISWIFMGTIPVTINANGIFLSDNGMRKIISLGSGTVKSIEVHINDMVEKEQLIATIIQPELSYDILQVKENILLLNSDRKSTYDEIEDLNIKLKELKWQEAMYSNIKSPCKGKIIDLMVSEDDYVEKGSRIATVELSDAEMECILYIPVSLGKKIRTGMNAQISPSNVPSSVFGFMMGTVSFVSDYPSSRERMKTVLENEALFNMFTAEGPPIEVHVELKKDLSTVSGYYWSSSNGPPFKMTSGTLCNSVITITEFKPLTLILPKAE